MGNDQAKDSEANLDQDARPGESQGRDINQGEEQDQEHDQSKGKRSIDRRDKDLFSLFHEVSIRIGRGPRQGLVVRPGQNKVLKTLEKHDGEMSQGELKRILDVNAGGVSELLRKLENENYVERRRSKTDKRAIIVTLTERGHVAALESRLSEKERDAELFGCLSQRDRAELKTLLKKLLETWDEINWESEGARRERRWQEISEMQDEQREVNALLEEISLEST